MAFAIAFPGKHILTPATRPETGAPRWSLPELSGRLVELSSPRGGAQLTFALRLVREAQGAGETSAWIGPRSSSFFPPDASASGIDLAALPVVRLEAAQEMGRAADQLLRSGAFGLLVIDLGAARIADPLLTRLLGLAQKHQAAVLFLTEKSSETPSLSSLISLRAEVAPTRRRARAGKLSLREGEAERPSESALREVPREVRFVGELRALKDKRRAPGWLSVEEHDGPAGLR